MVHVFSRLGQLITVFIMLLCFNTPFRVRMDPCFLNTLRGSHLLLCSESFLGPGRLVPHPRGTLCSITTRDDKCEDLFFNCATSLRAWLSILIKICTDKTAVPFFCFTKLSKYFICNKETEGPSKLCGAICFRN